MDTATLKNESAPGREFAELTAQARAAYQEKRIKECIDITERVLLADPGNAEANSLHEAILADIQRDLNDARSLLEDSRIMAEGQKYRKAAEIILLKILYIDSTHAEARELLSHARGSSGITTGYSSQPIRAAARLEESGFTASPTPVVTEPEPRGSGSGLKVSLIFAALVVLGGGVWFVGSMATGKGIQSAPPAPVTRPVEGQASSRPPAGANRNVVNPVVVSPALAPKTLNAVPVPPVPVPATREVSPPAATTTPQVAPAPAPATKSIAAAREPGSLAVNSPIAADIYLGDRYLGATPTTLQLPPGRHTIEYRSGDLRTSMVHDIRSRETTTALVAFELTIQINAKPWALVYVEGSSRRQLGQTPLSSVRVPIGSLLTFENPTFQPKSHRVKVGDSAIQVVFP